MPAKEHNQDAKDPPERAPVDWRSQPPLVALAPTPGNCTYLFTTVNKTTTSCGPLPLTYYP